ncbi:hypothetical protein CHUAL_000016 [Chamberlinius hualienensis]
MAPESVALFFLITWSSLIHRSHQLPPNRQENSISINQNDHPSGILFIEKIQSNNELIETGNESAASTARIIRVIRASIKKKKKNRDDEKHEVDNKKTKPIGNSDNDDKKPKSIGNSDNDEKKPKSIENSDNDEKKPKSIGNDDDVYTNHKSNVGKDWSGKINSMADQGKKKATKFAGYAKKKYKKIISAEKYKSIKQKAEKYINKETLKKIYTTSKPGFSLFVKLYRELCYSKFCTNAEKQELQSYTQVTQDDVVFKNDENFYDGDLVQLNPDNIAFEDSNFEPITSVSDHPFPNWLMYIVIVALITLKNACTVVS